MGLVLSSLKAFIAVNRHLTLEMERLVGWQLFIITSHCAVKKGRGGGVGVFFTPGERMSGFLAASVFMLCQDKLCQEAKLRQVDWVLLIGSCFSYIP